MARSNRDRVGTALDSFVEGYRPFILQQMDARHGADKGEGKCQEFISQAARSGTTTPAGSNQWDTGNIITILLSEWQYLFRLKLGKAERGMLNEVEVIRNNWAHQQVFSTEDTLRALDTIKRLLSAIGAADQVNDVDKLHGEVMRTRITEMQRVATDRARRQATEGTPLQGLKAWRDIITPHRDVCNGTFAQAEFAADLAQVHRGDALPEYGDAKEFYRRTYITEGLRGLLLNALKRLNGQGGHPVVELQTNFGGGKTHSMMALYHLVSGIPAAQLAGVDALLADAGVNNVPKTARAVLVGTALSAGQPEKTPEGLVLRTLWGRLAYQIGNAKGYEMIRESDETGTSPGSDNLVKLLKSVGPVLILIDELVAYCRQMYETNGLPGGSFDANLSFSQSLTEAVKAVPTALLVSSLPQSDIEVGGEGGKQALARLEHTFSRLEFNWRPASAEESYEIVRRRLFEPIADPNLFADRDAVVRAFATVYRQNSQDFPSECREGDYERRLTAAYPIHPELFDRLYNDWSSLEEFQRTRGVLRLMSQVIYTLWSRNDRSLMVLPGLVPIDEPTVESELTRYLTNNWPVIIEKDVDGQQSVPARIDSEVPRFGQVWATRRVARTIYMGSAPVAGTANRGLDLRHVRLGCVQPGENIAVFGDALKQLGDNAAHLYADGARYWYSTQPNVTTTARDRAARKTEDDILFEISRRLRDEQATRGGFAKVYPAPDSSGDVPDEVDCRLVLLPPEKTHSHAQTDSPAMLAAAEILEKRGTSPRIYQNTLVFLAADKTRLNELKSAVALHLAWKSIYDEREALGLDPFNVKLAEKRETESDRTVAARIPETYQWLLVPEQPDPLKKVECQAVRLTGADALATRASKRLERDGLMWTSLAGAVLRATLDKLLWTDADHIGVRKMKDYFPQYVYLPRLSRADLVLDAIRDGLASTVWASDTFAYASAFDPEKGRYAGLQAGRIGIVVTDDPNSVIVKPTVAQKQLGVEQSLGQPGQPPTSGGAGTRTMTLPGTQGQTGTASERPTPSETPQPTRFFGTVTVDPQRINRDIDALAAEVIHHLAKLPNAVVKVTVEIQADAPGGVPDDVVRTVSENCRTLKFTDHGFEKE
jgi:uncharacterized protein